MKNIVSIVLKVIGFVVAVWLLLFLVQATDIVFGIGLFVVLLIGIAGFIAALHS